MSTLLAALIKKNLVTAEQLLAARKKQSGLPRPVQDLLIEAGHLSEEDLFAAARNAFPRPVIDLEQAAIDPELVRLIPRQKAMGHGIFPVMKEKDILVLAMSDPSDIMARDEIGFMTGLTVRPLLCKKSQIAKYIKKYYQAAESVHEILKDTIDDVQRIAAPDERAASEETVDLVKFEADNSSFVRFVNKIISDAVAGRASDIHIEPQEKTVDVRYRIDGHLKNIIRVPRDLQPRLTARIKILAKLDIAEQRKVQEGRIKILIGEDKIDLRISVIPLVHGEKIVMRILDRNSAQFDLNKIGFQPQELEIFKEAIHRPQGVILVTGPTGSGKTTTLYSALQHIRSETKNIVTIEDPIEYLIEGINQIQLSRFKDVTFANGLRSILRQDPDIILVGEIRDKETAEIAFRASLTGHLVFSTLHTNNAASSITRLLSIGLESYLIASSITLLVSQRLVRLICPNCYEEDVPDETLLLKFRNIVENVDIKRFYAGRGCEQCNLSGFYGRTSIFEILRVDEKIRDLIFNKAPENHISREAVAGGMRTLAQSGIIKVAAGLTTLREVAKVTDMMEGNQAAGIFN